MVAIASPDAQAHCQKLTQQHYENFPVASFLLPRRLRGPVAAIYAFARTADDIADEGDLHDTQRLALLDLYSSYLDALKRGHRIEDPVFVALGAAITEHTLPFDPFYDLLAAFRQDVVKKRYRDAGELLAYCQKSANPVGRLLLRLFSIESNALLVQSDAICTALQLINFLQDITVDFAKGRIYLPEDEMASHGVTEDHFVEGRRDAAWRSLMRCQIERAHDLLRQGSQLGNALPGRLGLEIRATVAGGFCVLDKLKRKNTGETISTRLGRWDWVRMLARAILRIDSR